jgi:hypothetical protein
MEFAVLVLSCFLASAIFGVEVVLARFAGQKLAVFRDFDALLIGLIGFHRHIVCSRTYYGFKVPL